MRECWWRPISWWPVPGLVLVPAERSADLRRYYAKNDRLDSHVLARMALLHPEGLHPIGGLGRFGISRACQG